MARKTDKKNIHEFTRQIHSTVRTGTTFANMANHNEEYAKRTIQTTICCKNCRQFYFGCCEYIGEYHKPCDDFKWD